MIWLYWTIKRRFSQRKQINEAMREMRRSGYRAYGLMRPHVNWNSL